MYLNASTDSIEIILAGTVTTNQLQWNVSYQDITSSGMTLPQSAGAGLTNNTTLITMIAAPAASTTRQVTQINVYNADTATATVTIRKDVSGTKYVLMRIALTTLDVLMWSREDGWRLMSATGGGTTYTFSTGLTNTSGTVTSNLSTGVAGGQSVIGGTAASNSLTLSSTSNATKGKILFGTSAYDEVNNRLGINQSTPLSDIHIGSSTNSPFGSPLIFIGKDQNAESNFQISNSTSGTAAQVGLRIFGANSRSTSLMEVSAGHTGFPEYVKSLVIEPNDVGTLEDHNLILSLSSTSATSTIRFYTGGRAASNRRFTIFASTGNALFQSGGTHTDAGFRLDVNGTARFQDNVTISTKNIITDTATGTKIATANTQKLGFWNATPIVQPTTAVTAATRVGGGGTTLTDTDTFDGYTLAQVVKALRNAGLLA